MPVDILAIRSASTERVLSALQSLTSLRENSFAHAHHAKGKVCTPNGYVQPCMPFVLHVGAEDISLGATQPARLGWQRHSKPLRLQQTRGLDFSALHHDAVGVLSSGL